MTKFTHPKDAPEGHEWEAKGSPVKYLHTQKDGGLLWVDVKDNIITTNASGRRLNMVVLDAPEKITLIGCKTALGWVFSEIDTPDHDTHKIIINETDLKLIEGRKDD